jgi:DNA polymerase I-like protein with 3'-5' exonuclease and polymerase domains
MTQPIKTPIAGSVKLNKTQFSWSLWNGELLGDCIAIDTETILIEDRRRVPDLCLVSVSDGQQHFVLQPCRLAELLELHLSNGTHLICHNIAFDFPVMDKYLTVSKEAEARNLLWTAVDENRVHDTMLLAVLISLAQNDCDLRPSLESACDEHLGVVLEKDEYRLRFNELKDTAWSDVDVGFFQYAVKDAIATWFLFAVLTHMANEICQKHGVTDEFGFLTESIQVKAAIGLDRITRNGMSIDLDRLKRLRADLESGVSNLVEEIHTIAPDVWRIVTKTGDVAINARTGLPRVNQKALRSYLLGIAERHRLDVLRTGKGEVSLSTKTFWGQHRNLDPLIDLYCEYSGKTKLRSFFAGLNHSRIHPKYETIKRTGRTSCSQPNIQQLPAGSPIREVVVASPGKVLFIIDYSCIELRTLASECHRLFGHSCLRKVLVEGKDPHSYTAAMFADISLDEFEKHSDRKQLRQHAKVFNFGIPGGFGPKSLVDFAKLEYGIDLTVEGAERFIRKLTHDVYPELRIYLSEDTMSILATKLLVAPLELQATWPEPYHLGMLQKIIQGNPYRADGTPYRQTTVDRMWLELHSLCRNPDLLDHITSRNTAAGSPLRYLFESSVSTATGRIRGGVRFTQSKNTPFQGLAADGCKLALWNLTKAGYRVIAFIHDEFVIELPESDHYTEVAADINRICCESMEQFVPGIPVTCEYAVTRRWSKKAEAVYDDAGRLLEWTSPNQK